MTRKTLPPQANVEAQIEWLKARLASLQLPAGKRDHDTREKWLFQCGMPAAIAARSEPDDSKQSDSYNPGADLIAKPSPQPTSSPITPFGPLVRPTGELVTPSAQISWPTDDVVNLVIAAREAFDCAFLPDDESRALDKALEPFASKVRYANEPDDEAAAGADNG